MGSYYRSRLMIKADNVNEILDHARSFDTEFVSTFYNRFSSSIKWNPIEITVELSRKFPKAIFFLEMNNNSSGASYREFYLNGECTPYDFVFPFKFPSASAIKTANRKYKERLKQYDEQQNLLRKEKEELEKQNKISALKKQLEQLECAS